MKKLPDFEPCAGDGLVGGAYCDAKLFGALTNFLNDPINFQRVKEAVLLHAPPDDQELLGELIANLQAGIRPDEDALQAVLEYGNIFSGLTLHPNKGEFTDDTGFVDDEPWRR